MLLVVARVDQLLVPLARWILYWVAPGTGSQLNETVPLPVGFVSFMVVIVGAAQAAA